MKASQDYPRLLTARLVEALREQDWVEAVEEFQALDATRSDGNERLVLWAELLDELGRQGCGWPDWAEHWPGGEAALDRGVYFLVLGIQALGEESFDRAGYFLVRAAETCPASHVPVAYMGVLHETMGCPSEALVHYQRCLDLAPDLFSVLNAAGNLYHELCFYQEAAGCYSRALALLTEPVNRSVVLGNLANSLRAVGKTDDAIAAYTEAVALCPSHTRAPLALAETLLEARRPQEAIGCLSDVIATPGYDEWPEESRQRVHECLARACTLVGAHPAAVANWWQHLGGDLSDEGSEGVRALLKSLYAWAITHPGDADCEKLLARVNRRVGYLDAALLHAKRAVKRQADGADAFEELGGALLLIGKENVALEALDEAAALAPHRAELHAMRAMALWREAPKAAEEALLEAIRIAPYQALHRCDLGWLRLAVGDPGGAQAAFIEALLLWDRAPVLHGDHGPVAQRGCFVDLLDAHAEASGPGAETLTAANFALLSGRRDQGRALLARVLTDRPDHHAATRNFAWLMSHHGSPAEAAAWWTRVAQQAPHDSIARFFLLRARSAAGGDARSGVMQELERWLGDDPDCHLAHLLAGKLLEPTEAAVPHLEHLVNCLPGMYSPWYWLGQLHFHRREPEVARPSLERCVGLNPDFNPARQLLARCYALLGDDARSALHQGVSHLQTGQLHRARAQLELALSLDPAMHRAAEALEQVDRNLKQWTAAEGRDVLRLLSFTSPTAQR